MVKDFQSLTAGNAVPAQQFSHFAPVDMCQRVQPVNAGNRVLHFEIVQAAGGQDEPSVPKRPRQFRAFRMDIAECQPKSPARGSQAFARSGSALWHDTRLSACNVPAEAETQEQRYESHCRS